MRVAVVHDVLRVDERTLVGAFEKSGHRVELCKVGERCHGDVTLLRVSDPYVALLLAPTLHNPINSEEGLLNALNRARALKALGVEYRLIYGDVPQDVALPAYALTGWRTQLDGVVDSYEGLKSIVEYRVGNVLSSVTLLLERPLEVFDVLLIGDPLLERLGMEYARVKFARIGGSQVPIDIDPVPRLDREAAERLAEHVVSKYG